MNTTTPTARWSPPRLAIAFCLCALGAISPGQLRGEGGAPFRDDFDSGIPSAEWRFAGDVGVTPFGGASNSAHLLLRPSDPPASATVTHPMPAGVVHIDYLWRGAALDDAGGLPPAPPPGQPACVALVRDAGTGLGRVYAAGGDGAGGLLWVPTARTVPLVGGRASRSVRITLRADYAGGSCDVHVDGAPAVADLALADAGAAAFGSFTICGDATREVEIDDVGVSGAGANPLFGDADSDGLPDDWEAARGVADRYADGDGDGLSSVGEYFHGTDPLLRDTDGDGYTDAQEVALGRDPLTLLYTFDHDGDAEGWAPVRDITGFRVGGGALSGASSGIDPQVRRPGLAVEGGEIDGDALDAIAVRLRMSVARTATLYWATQTDPVFRAERRVDLAYTTPGQYQTLVFDVAAVAGWRADRIVSLRLDPLSGAAGITFDVDAIWGVRDDSDSDGVPDSVEGLADHDGDGLPDSIDADSDANGIPDSVEVAGDADGDSIPDGVDPDDDGDGTGDREELLAGTDHARVAFEFEAAGGAEGWTVLRDIGALQVADGKLSGTSVGADPQIRRAGMGFPPSVADGFAVRMRVTRAGTANLYWSTQTSPAFTADKRVDAQVSADGEFHTLVFRLLGHPGWDQQRIIALRLDPIQAADTGFEIDWIRPVTGDSDGDGFDDIEEGATDADGDGAPNCLDLDSDGNGVADATEGVSDADGDGIPDYLDPDGDGDGVSDAGEIASGSDPSRLSYEFNSDGDTEGWQIVADIDALSVTGGSLSGNTLGSDPRIWRAGLGFPADTLDGIAVRARVSKPGVLGVYWGVQGDPGFKVERHIDVQLSASEGFSTVVFRLLEHAAWRGQRIVALRLDPGAGAGVHFDIDWIRAVRGDSDGDVLPDVDEGGEDPDGDGIPNWSDTDSDGNGIADGVEGTADPDGDGIPEYVDADDDGDGIPDPVEIAAGGDPRVFRYDFDRDGDAEGWTAQSHIDRLSVAGGALRGVATDFDPQLVRRAISLPGDAHDGIAVRMRASTDKPATLYWATAESNTFVPERKVVVAGAPGDTLRTLVFNTSAVPGWRGQRIVGLRVDPFDYSAGSSFAVDAIWSVHGDSDGDGIADVEEGAGDPDGDGIPNWSDTDSDGNAIADAVEGKADRDRDGIPDHLDPDNDGDGMPDIEEIASPARDPDVDESTRDSDGDGWSDLEEILQAPAPGYLLAEFWEDVPGAPVESLTSSPAYRLGPDRVRLQAGSRFAGRSGERYGMRLRGYLVAPASGDVILCIAGDESAELWFAESGASSAKERVAWTTSPTGREEWTKDPAQRSRAMHLEAGKRYYIEALLKENSGDDHLEIGWQLPGAAPEAVPSEYLESWPPCIDDPDGDGWSTEWEIANGFDPHVLDVVPAVEAGRVTITQNSPAQWIRVYFTRRYRDPVVVAGPVRLQLDEEGPIARARKVTPRGFEIQLGEWGYLDGAVPATSVGWIVAERGARLLASGAVVEAGRQDAVPPGNTPQASVLFKSPFFGTPVVLAQAAENDPPANPAVARLRPVGNAGFEVVVQREEALRSTDLCPANIHWLALQPGEGEMIDGLWTAGTVSWTAGHTRTQFNRDVSGSAAMAQIQTMEDMDTANITSLVQGGTNFRLKVQEERSLDQETSHRPEELGFLVTDPGTLGMIPTPADGDADALPDEWEMASGLDPTSALWADGHFGDPDGDGLINRQEYLEGTDPLNPDSDWDGAPDREELDVFGSDPTRADVVGSNVVASVAPRDYASSSIGWSRSDAGWILASGRRGTIDYRFSVPGEGIYLYRVKAGIRATLSQHAAMALEISVDGIALQRHRLESALGRSGSMEGWTQWLAAGEHVLRIHIDNPVADSLLRIDSVEVLTVGGVDTDGDGEADQIAEILGAANTLTAGSESATSPACVEGTARIFELLALGREGAAVTPLRGPDNRWCAEIELDPDHDTALHASFQGDRMVVEERIEWSVTDLATGASPTIRKGDSLRLTAAPSLGLPSDPNSVNVDLDIGDGAFRYSTKGGKPIIHRFDTAGVVPVRAHCRHGNREVDLQIAVTVLEASFGANLPALQDTRLAWSLPALAPTFPLVVDASLTLDRDEPIAEGGRRIYLTPHQRGTRHLWARTGEGGPVLARGAVDVYSLANAGETADVNVVRVYENGDSLVRMSIVVAVMPPGGGVLIELLAGGVLFTDGTRTRSLSAADFDANGIALVEFVVPEGSNPASCHRATLLDADGDPIGVSR